MGAEGKSLNLGSEVDEGECIPRFKITALFYLYYAVVSPFLHQCFGPRTPDYSGVHGGHLVAMQKSRGACSDATAWHRNPNFAESGTTSWH